MFQFYKIKQMTLINTPTKREKLELTRKLELNLYTITM